MSVKFISTEIIQFWNNMHLRLIVKTEKNINMRINNIKIRRINENEIENKLKARIHRNRTERENN